MSEVSISSARASVMVYDDVNKKWVPSGSSSGLSKVQLYHHQVNNTFRVVGRKLQDHEIVINCAILKGLKYNQATVTFHQWRDNKQVYGLNFSSKDDADAFAKAMLQALDVLSNGSNISRSLGPTVAPATQQQPVYQAQQQQQPANAQYDEDMGYSQTQSQVQGQCTMATISRVSLSLGHLSGVNSGSQTVPLIPNPNQNQSQNQNHPSISSGTTTVIQVGCSPCSRGSPAEAPMRTMTREDVAIIQERRMSQQNQPTNSPSTVSPSCPPLQQQQQQQSGHHRTSSAPPAPQPQPNAAMPGPISAVGVVPGQIQGGGPPPAPPPQPPQAPPAPPCPPSMMMFNAPVPPPMMNQYAATPSQSSLSNISNKPQQSQYIYASNQPNQYGTIPGGQHSTSQSQYASGSQTGHYASNGQTVYAASQGSQSVQYGSTQGSQYAASNGSQSQNGSQYGSSNSINQYASGQSQYASVSGQSQYVNQGQYVQGGTGSSSPYGTPSNSLNQYQASHVASANSYVPIGSTGPPPPPMGPPAGPAAPPPPPPPPAPNATNCNALNSSSSSINAAANSSEPPPDTNSLAAALQAARLKKKQQSQPVENSGSSTSSSGSGGGGGNYGTLGRGGGGGMASMMDEMAKTLARRRAAVEKKQPEQPPEPESSPDKKSWDKNNSSNNKFANGAESPKSARKRFGSASEDTLLKVNGVNDGSPLTAQDMEAFKAEIMKEMRKEMQKMKQEFVDVLRTELSRR